MKTNEIPNKQALGSVRGVEVQRAQKTQATEDNKKQYHEQAKQNSNTTKGAKSNRRETLTRCKYCRNSHQ